MSDELNVLETTASNEEVKKEEVKTEKKQDMSQVLKLVDKNRDLGIKQMQRSVDGQEGRPMLDSTAENTVRNLEQGVQGALTSVEALNSLVDMIRHDLMAMIQNLQQVQQAAVMSSTQTGTLIELLKSKEMITEEELMTVFKQFMEQQQKRQGT